MRKLNLIGIGLSSTSEYIANLLPRCVVIDKVFYALTINSFDKEIAYRELPPPFPDGKTMVSLYCNHYEDLKTGLMETALWLIDNKLIDE